MNESSPDPAVVRAQLRAVTAGAAFRDSELHRKLLEFLVETTLRGEAESLKEFVVAAEVWGRDVSFDPRIHSMVRVAVGRLRTRLRDHYAGEGANDRIQFRIPTGSYAVLFEPAATQLEQPGEPSPVSGDESHFEILQLIGRGGMGEVWKARDRRLGRDVALKFISKELAENPAARERFEREARAAAALNHPNICTVYDVGENGGQPFLAMELLEGETLEHRLGRESVPLASLVDWGIEISDALEAAHSRGIVHSDLKPANLFLTVRGQTKILDFGLARLVSERKTDLDGGGNHGAAGTPGYMSPEQIKGEELDSRSDIYSLGIILYRAAAGRLPGESSGPPSSHNALVPADLDRIIAKALEDDREVRYQHASELRADLKRLKRDSDAGAIRQAVVLEEAGRRRRWWAVWAALAGLAAAGAFLSEHYLLRNRVPFREFQITRMTDTQDIELTAISPDGKYLATVRKDPQGKETLWIHHLPSNSDRKLLDDPEYSYVRIMFSPDSNYIYFRAPGRDETAGSHAAGSDVYRVPVIGGEPTLVIQGVHSTLSFIDDGQRMCFYRGNAAEHSYSFISANIDGGDERVLVTEPTTRPPGSSACSPDGKRAALTFHEDQIEVLDFASGRRKTLYLPPGDRWYVYGLTWMPDGKGLIVATASKGTVLLQLGYVSYPAGEFHEITNDLNTYTHGVSVTVDGKTLATTEGREDLAFLLAPAADPSKAQDSPFKWIENFSWTDDHTVAAIGADGTLKRVDLGTRESAAVHVPQGYFFTALGSCGPGSIAAAGGSRGGPTQGIFRIGIDGNSFQQLTHGKGDTSPECSRDSQWLVYLDLGDIQNPRLMRVAVAGGSPQRIETAGEFAFSGDGKLLAEAYYDHGLKLAWFSTATWQKVAQAPIASATVRSIGFASDNKTVLLAVNESGTSQIWEQGFGGGPARLLASLPGRQIKTFRISPNGKQIGFAAFTPQADAVILQDKSR
jgi:serine/threonine protein kinase